MQKQKLLRLRDTRGNFSLAIKLPKNGYEAGYNRLKAAVQKLREYEYSKQYYKRPYVIAKRRTRKAKKAKKEYDRIRNARPELKKRRRELQRVNRAAKRNGKRF